MKKRILIVASPSGGGKSTFIHKAINEFSELFDIVTYTTRQMRTGESQGNPYFFISDQEFKERIEQSFFVEWAKVHTHYYGTARNSIEDCCTQGKVAIMDLDIQGVTTLVKVYPEAETVFLLPPSIDELRRRVLSRDKTPPKDLEIRMKTAQKEIAAANQFKHQIINDNFTIAYSQFKKIIEDLVRKK